jgi:hypothetical protein
MSRLFFCANNARIVEIGLGTREVNRLTAGIGVGSDFQLFNVQTISSADIFFRFLSTCRKADFRGCTAPDAKRDESS